MPLGSPAAILARQYLTTSVPNPVTTTETVVATITPENQGGQSFPGILPLAIRVSGNYNVTPGTAATSVTMRLRQGTTTGGTQVGGAQQTQVIAADPQTISFSFQDTTGYLQQPGGPFPYVITAQQAAATGNATSNMIETEVSG